MSLSCLTCKYAVLQDYGYSNWTVEGTYFRCLKDLHPEGSFDRWYGEEPRLNYAANCTSYINGCPTELDVDLQDLRSEPPYYKNYSDDEEIINLLEL